MLPRSAEVVVIGAGVTGASIAYYLGRRGLRNVVLLEQDALGSGATSKAAGGGVYGSSSPRRSTSGSPR